MTTRYLNASVGVKVGDRWTTRGPSHGVAASGDVSIAYDDTKFTSRAQLLHALQDLVALAAGSTFLTA